MKRGFIGKAVIVSLLALHFSPPSWALDITGSCHVTFLGTSTLHDFTGTVRSLPFHVHVIDGGPGGKIIPAVTVDVPVDEIVTGEKKRDRQMREMFDSKTFPFIRGTVTNIDPDGLRGMMQKDENGEAPVALTLRIRDIELSLPATFSAFREYGEQISFEVRFFVSLPEYALKPPSLLFGLIQVGDRVDVTVTFDLEVKPDELFTTNKTFQEGQSDAGVAAPH
ncbi:MAG: hypothetical protein GTN70_06250 [Deltaproteobacteria bacterium]|nr:hypothetical protein [Deltaproteobacteria bacterium]NIS77282.1 hypothetical protein [Deltaproteobacteria bacterium]